MLEPRVVHCKLEPDFDVYVGRGRWLGQPSLWKNAYSHRPGTAAQHVVGSVAEAIACFEADLRTDSFRMSRLHELTGKTLACWCKTVKRPDAPCHGDVLVRLANGSEGAAAAEAAAARKAERSAGPFVLVGGGSVSPRVARGFIERLARKHPQATILSPGGTEAERVCEAAALAVGIGVISVRTTEQDGETLVARIVDGGTPERLPRTQSGLLVDQLVALREQAQQMIRLGRGDDVVGAGLLGASYAEDVPCFLLDQDGRLAPFRF